MAKPYDTKLIMMVAQQSFETADLNKFCKLIPVVYVDETEAKAADFPNEGEIWWMLISQTARLANPGQLIVGIIEDAVRFDEGDLSSSAYQVKRDTVQDLSMKEGMEVIDLPGDALDNPHDLVSGRFRLDLAMPPTPFVMLRWRSHVYGPFLASLTVQGATNKLQELACVPANPTDMTVFQIDELIFDNATRGHRFAVANDVSLTSNRRSEAFQLTHVKHDLVLASGYERVLATNPPKLVLEPLDRKLVRYAKQCLTRKKRQELQGLLNELGLIGSESEGADDLIEAIARIKQLNEKQEAALDVVAKALLESGLLGDDRIVNAEKNFAEKYIQERTAELQAKVEEAITQKRDEHRKLETQMKDIQGKLKKEEAKRRAMLDQELAAERTKADQEIAEDREEFEKQKAELVRQQALLKQNLEKVTKNLREAGDDVVNQFLTIAPLLGLLGLSNGQQVREDRLTKTDSDVKYNSATFKIPAFVSSVALSTEDELKEEDFFNRFQRVVEDSGFNYRPLDLQRFHLSVKCGDLTVLGGPSGTGKSTLPALYTQALLGEDAPNRQMGCLMVNINPSWMDTRDLLGHMNTLESRFYPAESGLFQYLIYAQEEYKARGAATGMYLTCLDEMNLSQVEHYFSDFMMVLERCGPSRTIQCFSPEIAGKDCLFRDWGKVALSPALRFVGTVNFDETTRLLSDRFLDRVNLIRLKSAALPGVARAGDSLATAEGRMVTLADIDAWRTDSALPSELGLLLDQIRPHLTQLGCPISPRVYQGLCRFVGSSAPVMIPSKAFDVQVAQRIISRVRSLVTKRQLDALDQLLQLLIHNNVCSFDESIPLVEEILESAGTRGWELEE
jgi:hypothetical protein